MKNLNLFTCNACGWVHFGVSKGHAQQEIDRFNEFYDAAPDETKAAYGGKSSMGHYDRCQRCGNPWTNFRGTRDGDCPDGCTIGPIITEDA